MMGSEQSELVFITPTWAGDLDHFRVMRCSLEYSRLGQYPHYVVVQTEDLPLFEEFRDRPGLHLLSTSDVLPPVVERRRASAYRLERLLGRHATRLLGSMKRVLSWPLWPSYTGWHTQQLAKLKLAQELGYGKAVVLDSDVVVTRAASVEDFISANGVVCFADWKVRDELRGKVRNWIDQSERLVGAVKMKSSVNAYFDTPFVFDVPLLREALKELASREGKDWWQVFLDCPPRRWSEFGFYKAFLNRREEQINLEWREPVFSRYLYDSSNPEAVISQVETLLNDPEVHYITIHSQASGRESWRAEEFLNPLLSILKAQATGD